MTDPAPVTVTEAEPAAPEADKVGTPGVQATLERLFQLHPKLFGARFVPLKLGVFHDLMARHPGVFSKDELKAALGRHARSTRYLESVANGQPRHDLDGNPVEPVALDHVIHAIAEVHKRRQGRNPGEAATWMSRRLLAALSAAELTRAEFLERFGSNAELAQAALQVFDELAARAARRDALRQAFQSSGVTVEAFAEMYGMDVGEARRSLQ